jgi:uncharacterized protein
MTNQQEDKNRNALKEWADDVVCPACFASLRFEATTVVCTGCSRIFPIVDGIPVLIPQRAIQPTTK